MTLLKLRELGPYNTLCPPPLTCPLWSSAARGHHHKVWAYLSWLTHTAGSLAADVLDTSPQPISFAIWLLSWKCIFFSSTARAVDSGSFKTCASEVFRGIRCPVFSEGVSGVLLSRHLSESDLTRSDMPLKPHLLDPPRASSGPLLLCEAFFGTQRCLRASPVRRATLSLCTNVALPKVRNLPSRLHLVQLLLSAMQPMLEFVTSSPGSAFQS